MNQRAKVASLAGLCAASFGLYAGCGPSAKGPDTAKAVSPPQTISCPEGKVLSGTECVPAAPSATPEATCPDGSPKKEGACAPAAPDCPPGTHVGANGNTCVADETPDQNKAETTPPAGPCPAGMAFVKGGKFKTAFLKVEAVAEDVCLDITEVMTKDYEACVNAGKCTDHYLQACTETTTWKKAGKEDHPMVCIDFTQAEAYCKFVGKRLPKDEEWEWAARGGEEGRLYSWGNDPPGEQACWSGGKAPRTGTCPVNAHPGTATPQGLLGMSGNVFEWTTTKLDPAVKQRTGRGGSWRDGLPNLLQVGRPGSFEITYRCGFLGVRCAVEPKKQ